MRRIVRMMFAAPSPAAGAATGGLTARDAPRIYARLDKPRWAPPAAVFGPAWTVLYTLIGAAGWRVTARGRRATMSLHLAQPALNASWTPLFFGAGRRRAALAVSVALDGAIAAEMLALSRDRDYLAAALLGPYLGWSGFATALTASVGDPG